MKKLTKRSEKEKKRKTIKRKQNQKIGGKVLDSGTEGCILDSVICDNSSYKNGKYVAKIFKTGLKNDYHLLQEILFRNDPNEERYAIYHEINGNECTAPESDLQQCEAILLSKLDRSKFFFTKKLSKIKDIRKLTKFQYRYLRDSVENLNKIGIIHGDLLDNVMLNENMIPVIIDWGHGSRLMTSDDTDMIRNFDSTTFLFHYAASKPNEI